MANRLVTPAEATGIVHEAMKAKQAEMLGASFAPWACPQCPYGWQCYMIATDMNICSVCGYKGGPIVREDA